MSDHQFRKKLINDMKMAVRRNSMYDANYTNYLNYMNSYGYKAYSKEKYLSKREEANRQYNEQLNSIKENLRIDYNNAINALSDFKNNYNSIYSELYKYNGEWYFKSITELEAASDFYEPFQDRNFSEIIGIESNLVQTKQGMDQEKEFLNHLLNCLNGEKAGI